MFAALALASDSAYSSSSMREELVEACSSSLPKIKRESCEKKWKKAHPLLKVR